MNEIHYSSKSNEWETPKYIFDYYNKIYNFQLDAAATSKNALCNNYFTIEDDGLNKDWSQYKTVWCNPPYGRLIGKFVKKAYEESVKNNIIVALLIPSRTDTKWWHEYCSKGNVNFIKGRLKFQNRSFPTYKEDLSHKTSPAPFPSAIVIFGDGMKTSYIDVKG